MIELVLQQTYHTDGQRMGGYIIVFVFVLHKQLTNDSSPTVVVQQTFYPILFSYCSPIWRFSRLGDLMVMDKAQRHLLFAYNDFHAPYSDLRSRAGRALLCNER